MTRLKKKLQNSDVALSGALCTIPSATVTQALSASGLDAVIIDLEHGAVDYGSAHAMIAATAGTDCAPMVRVERINDEQVKRVLDLGAEGIVFPLIRDAHDAEKAVASMLYPPNGTRGFGPFIAQSRWQTTLLDYANKMQDDLICCLTIETRQAVENIQEICKVPGIDLLVPAPFDLSTDLGISGQFDHPDFIAAVAKVEAAANAAGLPLAGVGLAEPQAQALFGRGYRMVVGFDILWLREKAAQISGWCAAQG